MYLFLFKCFIQEYMLQDIPSLVHDGNQSAPERSSYGERYKSSYGERNLSKTIKIYGPWSSAWVGEAGEAYNSGGNHVSNRFLNSFWYLDQLGIASCYSTKVYCKQTLIGGNYGLLNTTTFAPNPDYYRNHLGTLSDKEGIERWKTLWFATLGARGIFATNASLNTSVLMKTNCCRIQASHNGRG
ncbi:Heparanase-like protein 1 [Glycine max]|nr:Heparanase-like protein 1 [Glycine max]